MKSKGKITVETIVDENRNPIATAVGFFEVDDFLKFYRKSNVGKEVEERFDAELISCFDKLCENYLLEIVAPGSRTEADFRVQINIYEKRTNPDGTVSVKGIGYVKVDESRLESLAVPEFFLKIGRSVKGYIQNYK